LSDPAFWFLCLVSGAVAFAAVYVKGWRLTAAMIVGAAAGFLLSLLLLWVMPDEQVGHWFDVQLAVNGSVGVIFAGAGAAIGYAMRKFQD
jgi:hypothetical protein